MPDILTRFVYLVEGEPYVGTLNDFAKAYENAYYSDLDIDHDVYTFVHSDKCVQPHRVETIEASSDGYDENDYTYVTLTFRDENAYVRLDGRV